MFAALFKALAQWDDRRFRHVVVRSAQWAFLIFAFLVAILWWALAETTLFQLGWLEGIVDLLGGAAALVLGLILFPGVVMAVMGFMLEDIAAAVEERHYPFLPQARVQPYSEAIISALRLFAATVVVNILVLPAYLIPVINVFVFYAVNGYLVGREYFELVALRRLAAKDASALRRQYRMSVFMSGVAITVLVSIPVVGWIMPVFGVAMMVHLFESLRGRSGA